MKLLYFLLQLSASIGADVGILPRLLRAWDLPTNAAEENKTLHVQKEEKIYWGKDANASTAPFQILLYYGEMGLCGGAIIDQWWLVTAAHCTVMKNKMLNVGKFEAWAGMLHLLKESESEQHRYIDMIFPHEDYNDETLSHDIALLHFKDPLILSENVSVITIADETPLPGSTVRASGYGLTETEEVAIQLQYIEQSVPSRPDCLDIYGSYLDDSMWCSGEEEMQERAAVGDSGGPLVQMLDNIPELVGLVSYSIDHQDGKPAYDINCDVTKMKSWINNVMNRTWIELAVTKTPQVYSWSNKGLNYQTEYIKMKCNTDKFCRVQVKSLVVNFSESKHGQIQMYHDFDMSKEPLAKITPNTYSAVQAESGYASDTEEAMFVILLGQDNVDVNLTFTYQVLDDSACRAPSSQCNEVPDCLDLSDEIGCVYPNKTEDKMSENAVGCYPSDFECPDVGQGVWCIRRTHVCNGYTDCVGGSDETDKACGALAVSSSFGVMFLVTLFGVLSSV